MRDLAAEWARVLAVLPPAERELFEARVAEETARRAAFGSWTADQGPPPLGLPADWAHDGSERRFDNTTGYTCPRCKDVGYVRNPDLRPGQDGFGRAVWCECRGGYAAERAGAIRRRRNECWMPDTYASYTLDAFRAIRGTQEAYGAAHDWRDAWQHGSEPGWLALYGVTGCGKTHLLAALANQVLQAQPLIWCDVPWWLEQVAAGQFAAADEWMRTLHQAPVLVLDEFGAQHTQEWGRQRLETLLVERYGKRLPTLFGMVCAPDELADWSPRVASRFQDKTLVRQVAIAAPDYRARLQPAAPEAAS